jgi:hypothetical protein
LDGDNATVVRARQLMTYSGLCLQGIPARGMINQLLGEGSSMILKKCVGEVAFGEVDFRFDNTCPKWLRRRNILEHSIQLATDGRVGVVGRSNILGNSAAEQNSAYLN